MKTFKGIGGHHSALPATVEWLTPPGITAALGGASSFDLDPASPIRRPYDTARRHLTILDNGLLAPWRGRVWLNPPYTATEIGRWLGRMAEHGRGVALIFARTETEAFFRFVWERASALLFMRGRLNFRLPDGSDPGKNAGAPTVLCAYGARDADVLAGCGIDGQFVPLLIPRLVAIAMPEATWTDVVIAALRARPGPVRLDELYRALAHHPKARRNPNFDAKIRQVLQQGPFRRERRGEWSLA